VTVEPSGELVFATVFRPSLDGPTTSDGGISGTPIILPEGGEEIDRFFFPPIREKVTGYKLQIFNRLGVLIFQSNDVNVPWDGYYRGTVCPQGVYVWYVEGKYSNGEPFRQVGDITLLH
jgi:gliding motility-associated-like protein